jgi:hypothetical protein
MFNHPTVHALAKLTSHGADEDELVREVAASRDKLTKGKDRLRRQFQQLQHRKVLPEKAQGDYGLPSSGPDSVM